MRSKFEGEKPYIPTMTANDAYEQDMLQQSLAQSGDPMHQARAAAIE